MTSTNHLKIKSNSGTTLIEILISASLLAIIITAFVGSLASLGFSEIKSRSRTQANQLAREAIEIAYNLSLQDWQSFSQLEGLYHPTLVNSIYSINDQNSQGQETIDDFFTRSIIIKPATRDSNGHLSTTGPIIDPDTIKVSSVVSWQEAGKLQEIKLTSFLSQLPTSPKTQQ